MHYKNEQEPEGFEIHTLASPTDRFQTCRLYLPSDLAYRLREKEHTMAALEIKRREEQEATARAATRSPRTTSATFDLEAERVAVQVPDPASYRGRSHPVYDPYAPVELLARARTMTDKRDQERVETIYRQLAAKRSNLRDIGWPNDTAADLDALSQRLPHFKAVTQFVRERLEVAGNLDLAPRVPPMLLTGVAGDNYLERSTTTNLTG